MFDKVKFAQILKNINESYNSQRDFSKKSGINRTYLSQYMNMKLEEPPKPKILQKLSDASNGIIDYDNLMIICGYVNYGKYSQDVQTIISYMSNKNYDYLSNSFKKLLSLQLNNDELCNVIKSFTDCCQYILSLNNEKKLNDFTSNLSSLEKKGFNCLYIAMIKRLHCLSNVPRKKDELFNINKHLILKNDAKDIKEAFNIIDGFRNSILSFYEKHLKECLMSKYYMCPVYGQISAGQPNWVEENIEGTLPIDPNLMGILNPEECFFLRVNGESMNKVVRNGAFALIRKQDVVENGEIAVVLVNGFDATLKKFTKQGDLVILEPQSNDESFKTQVYDKNTSIKVLGKYIGKMEFNK